MPKKIGYQTKILLIIQAVLFLMFFTGCAKIERELEFKRSGLINMKVNIALNEDLIKLSYGSVDEFYSQMDSAYGHILNFRLQKIKTKIDGSDAYGVSLEGTASEEIIESLLSNIGVGVDIDKSGFFKKNIKISLTSNKEKEDTDSDDKDSFADSLSGMVITDSFIVTVPDKIYETNGYINEDNNREVSWEILDVETGKIQSKELTVSYIDKSAIVLTIVAAVFVVLGVFIGGFSIFYSVFAVKKEKNNNRNPLKDYLRSYEKNGEKIIFDTFIPGLNNEVGKIDAILIGHSGIFIFDKMRYSGWISGNEEDEKWLQSLEDESQLHFNNPIIQNLKQVEWIKNYFDKLLLIYSVIIFPENSNLNAVYVDNPKIKVIRGNDYAGIIESFKGTGGVLNDYEIEEIYNGFKQFGSVNS